MLRAVAELTQHGLRYVERVLRDKVDADAFRADETDDLLDEIDDVLEENAEDFVRAYVQKGGQ